MSKAFEIIPFHDYEIVALREGDDFLIPMKLLVDSMGLNWEPQRQRILRHPVLSKGIRVIGIPSQGGMQETVALPLEMLPGYLITIQSERITDEQVRQMVVLYQTDAFRVLFDHYIGGRKGQGPRRVADHGAAQDRLARFIDKLRSAPEPEARRVIHAMIVQICDELGIIPPAMDGIGTPALSAPALADEFFALLEEMAGGIQAFNHHRRDDLVAFSLPEIFAAMKSSGVTPPDRTKLCKSLAAHPAFDGRKPVNCTDGKGRHCWIFHSYHFGDATAC